MKQRTLLLVGISTLLSGLSLYTVLNRLSPLEDTWWLAYTLFFLSEFIFTASLFTLLGSSIRLFLYKHETYFFHFIIALRQGVLFALFATAFVLFYMFHVATIWNVLLLFLSILFVELYFLNRSPTA